MGRSSCMRTSGDFHRGVRLPGALCLEPLFEQGIGELDASVLPASKNSRGVMTTVQGLSVSTQTAR